MAIPRVPFGGQEPGRVPATMLKVLAAEISDPARWTRGRRYATDRAVTDIEVEAGVARCTVQGSRPVPYQVELRAAGGEGVPLRSELRVICDCPDADLNGLQACKHGVAALLTLAQEVGIEPEVLDRWRSGPRAATSTPSDNSGSDPTGGGTSDNAEDSSHGGDRFGDLLHWPRGTGPVTLPTLSPWRAPRHPDPQIEELLASVREALDLDGL